MSGDLQHRPNRLSSLLCAVICAPYFCVLFAALHAPRFALPVPSWGRKGVGPLGMEISPSLRVSTPHLWPHPIWASPLVVLVVCSRVLLAAAIVALLVGAPLLRAEHHAYLDRLKELPKYGFVPPTFGIFHGWRTFLFSLYLEFLARPDVHDLSPLRRSADLTPSFIPAGLPARVGARPTVPAGLPQRQMDQHSAGRRVPVWPRLVDDPKRQLHGLAKRTVLNSKFKAEPRVEVDLSPNEGAGAFGIICLECDCRCPEVARMNREFAHEHSADGSWHVVLSAADAVRVCRLGWAERGPPICVRSVFQPHFSFAPEGWVFLYAPRDEAEAAVVKEILEASHTFASTAPAAHAGGGRM